MDRNNTYSPQRYLGYCWIGIQIPHSVWAASRAPGIPHAPGSCCRPYPLRQRRPAATWLKMVEAATIRICVRTWGNSQRNQGFWWGKWWWFLKQSILKLFTEIEECKESMRPPACFLRGKRMRHLNHLAVSCKEKHETIWCNTRPETARVACGAVGIASGGTYQIVNTFYKVLPLCDRQQI